MGKSCDRNGILLSSFSANRSWLYRALCTGGVDPDDPYNPVDNPEHGCMSWFRDYLAAALNCRPVKAIIILIFAVYLAGALYGLTTLEEGLDRRKLSKNDSYSIVFYDRQDYYFREFPYRIQVRRFFRVSWITKRFGDQRKIQRFHRSKCVVS